MHKIDQHGEYILIHPYIKEIMPFSVVLSTVKENDGVLYQISAKNESETVDLLLLKDYLMHVELVKLFDVLTRSKILKALVLFDGL